MSTSSMSSRRYSTIVALLIIISFVVLDTQISMLQNTLIITPKPRLSNLGKIIKENVGNIMNKLSALQNPPEDESANLAPKKIILFWSPWFHSDWSVRFGDYDNLHQQGCPSWCCEFTSNKSRLHEANAVVFRSGMFSGVKSMSHRPSQMWVWVDVEAPIEGPAYKAFKPLRNHNLSKQVNWTMTYHRNADISAFYGSFLAVNRTVRPVRPQLMSSYPETMEAYQKARARGITLEEVMGSDWKSFVTRPRMVSWMSSHCPTNSRREEYVTELQRYINVDTFGMCGSKVCGNKGPLLSLCWVNVMRPNYLFYMAMENNICQDYVTEKLYLPLVHGLVPIVWGGSNYSDFLPPGSFIDARKYHPRDLAHLLKALENDPVRYGRYHVWRKFWKPKLRGSMCELCDKLHKDIKPKLYQDIENFRKRNGRCKRPPKGLFTRGNWPKYIGMDHSVP